MPNTIIKIEDEIMNAINLKNKIKKLIYPYLKLKYRVKSSGWYYIGKRTTIKNKKKVFIGKGTNISPNCMLVPNGKGIKFGENVIIGYCSAIFSSYYVEIEENVICAAFMFIIDSNHGYENVEIPIRKQHYEKDTKDNKVIIGADSWIGAHVTIIGNVRIGKHCVIAAGAVVNRDIPDYCVAAGVPAKVIKKYDFEQKKWVRV